MHRIDPRATAGMERSQKGMSGNTDCRKSTRREQASRMYTVERKGPTPADIGERVSALHAHAVRAKPHGDDACGERDGHKSPAQP